MSKKRTPAIVRDAKREHPPQAALAALDRSTAEEQKFDAVRRGALSVGQLWQEAHDAAESRGAPDPRACADRYLQGRELAAKIRGER